MVMVVPNIYQVTKYIDECPLIFSDELRHEAESKAADLEHAEANPALLI